MAMLPDNGEAPSDNGEAVSYKMKYRELKRRLKILVYEGECFESDIRDSEAKLLQISREKSYLLDQLMTRETVIISDDSDHDSTEYSSEEEKANNMEIATSRGSNKAATKATVPAVPGPSQKQPAPKPSRVRKQGRATKQTRTPRTPKTTLATTTAVVKEPTPSSLIVSLPRPSQEEAAEPRPLDGTVPRLKPLHPQRLQGKKIETVMRYSSSSSSTSGSGSSDCSDSESMDTAPPPLIQATSGPTRQLVHPSPKTKNQLNSHTLTTPTSKTTPTPQNKTLISLVTNSSSSSAFQMVSKPSAKPQIFQR